VNDGVNDKEAMQDNADVSPFVVTRSPAFEFVRRWGISIASLVGGLLTLFVFRRGLPRVGLIVGYLLLLWLLVAVLIQVRDTLATSERRTHRFVLTATEYAVQTLYHGVLLFLLPAYWAATTLTSVNVGFFLALVVLALIATFDPWYKALVHPRPWAGYVFFLVSLFGALNLALPLIGVPPVAALAIAAWIAVVSLTPAVCRARAWSWKRGLAVTSLLGLLAMSAALAGRRAIPPAPLFVADSHLGWNVGTVDSLEPKSPIPAAALLQNGLIAYTAIYAPAGLKQPVDHVWRLEGQVINVIRLTPVEGGRREGYRTFSRKTSFPADPRGRWTVDVTTATGQLIGRLRFRVAP
jgi:hypothetical protein